MFVTSAGITKMPAAWAGVITMLRRPMPTVGNPSPSTPLMPPASRNTAAMNTASANSDIAPLALIVRSIALGGTRAPQATISQADEIDGGADGTRTRDPRRDRQREAAVSG